MLSPRIALSLTLTLALCAVAPARAQDDADGLRRPERLTIGTADQFLGTVSPDGGTLYFASNRNTATELYAEDLVAGSSRLLFDEGADVTWPRVSPDGKQLLYISFRGDALGELCVRELPKGARRCLADGSGAVQAQWIDAHRVLMVSRPSAQGDMRVSIVQAGPRLSARTLFDRNLTGPAVSPDGRWLVYTPVERYVERIGPGFAAKAGRELIAQRIDRPELPPTRIELDAPGLTGQPGFSPDGKVLFFVQFVSDSNQDGVIDGGDNGVLFRAPFEQARDDAAQRLTGTSPEQLTDASWNCQYPFASAQRLLATCARGGHLDVYGLPLDGVVPSDWGPDRLRAEIDVTTRPFELLLLHAQLLQMEQDLPKRRNERLNLIRLHLQLDEFEAAEFHARHVAAQDRGTADLGTAMRVLCEHRRALRARERGHLSLDFAEDARKHLQQLAKGRSSSPAGDAMQHVLRSEIADVLGDKELAKTALEAVVLDGVTLASVLAFYADRADALYRELDERDLLARAYRTLAEHPALSATDRLGYARSAARTLTRGLSPAGADAALTEAKAAPGTDFAFAVALARAVDAVRDPTPSDEVRDRIIAIYRGDERPERRRAVMLDADQRGWQMGAHGLIQRLAELYVDDAPKGTIERRRAARLYKRLLEDRAYAHLGEGRMAEARDEFYAVANRTGSLESWAGYLDRRLQEGAKIEDLEAEYLQRSGDKDGPVYRFVCAYLLTRKLPKLTGIEATKAADRATAILRGGWAQLKDKPEAVSVLGSIEHERFLHGNDLPAAEHASALYLIALDLARRNPRYRATLLEQMALLQADVGNWRIAIDYFEQREKLPSVDSGAALAHRLIKARTLLHLDREQEAAALADEALAIVDRTPPMAQFRGLCLDRAALYNLAADRFDRALALYDQVVPLAEADRSASGPRNRLVTSLARGAAALGAGNAQVALDSMSGVDGTLATPGIGATLRWPHSTEAQVIWTYKLVTAGLRAKAFLSLGRLDEAERALGARRTLYEEQLKRSKVEEHVRALSLVESQLAELALARKNGPLALAHAKAALDHLAPIVKREGDSLDRDELVVLWLATEVRISTEARLKLKLRDRLGKGIAQLGREAAPKRLALKTWLEIYLGMLGKSGSTKGAAEVPRPTASR